MAKRNLIATVFEGRAGSECHGKQLGRRFLNLAMVSRPGFRLWLTLVIFLGITTFDTVHSFSSIVRGVLFSNTAQSCVQSEVGIRTDRDPASLRVGVSRQSFWKSVVV
jgi:hypothetical protein